MPSCILFAATLLCTGAAVPGWMDALVQSGKTDWFLLGFFRESIGFWFFLGMFALVILCGALSVRELVRGRHTAAGAPRG